MWVIIDGKNLLAHLYSPNPVILLKFIIRLLLKGDRQIPVATTERLVATRGSSDPW